MLLRLQQLLLRRLLLLDVTTAEDHVTNATALYPAARRATRVNAVAGCSSGGAIDATWSRHVHRCDQLGVGPNTRRESRSAKRSKRKRENRRKNESHHRSGRSNSVCDDAQTPVDEE